LINPSSPVVKGEFILGSGRNDGSIGSSVSSVFSVLSEDNLVIPVKNTFKDFAVRLHDFILKTA
jgi:hypothetical protein